MTIKATTPGTTLARPGFWQRLRDGLSILWQSKVALVGLVIVLFWVFAAILAILVLIIVLQNTENVETRILFTTITMPRAALLFGTLVIGFAVGVLTAGRIVSKTKTPPE